MAFSETHAVWQAFRLAPRILVEPHVVLAEQKARQEVKAIKQSNKLIQELKFPGNKTISENAQEEAYKKVFNDPMTEPYRKEAQDRDNLRFQGDDPIIGNPSMSEGTKYVFDEAQDEQVGGFGMPSSYSYKDRPRWDIDAIPARTEGADTKVDLNGIVDPFSNVMSEGTRFDPMPFVLPVI